METLNVGIVQKRKEREEENGVTQPNQAKEERHVELEGCAADSSAFQGDGVGAVEDGGKESEGVAEKEFGSGLGREGVGYGRGSCRRGWVDAGVIWCGGEVGVGDEDDAGE